MSEQMEKGQAIAFFLMRAVRDKRTQVGMTQADLAEACGVHQSQVSEAERCIHLPSIALACAMVDAVGLEVKLR